MKKKMKKKKKTEDVKFSSYVIIFNKSSGLKDMILCVPSNKTQLVHITSKRHQEKGENEVKTFSEILYSIKFCEFYNTIAFLYQEIRTFMNSQLRVNYRSKILWFIDAMMKSHKHLVWSNDNRHIFEWALQKKKKKIFSNWKTNF